MFRSTVEDVVAHIRSGCQAMRIVTPEETRALETLKTVTKKIAELDSQPMSLVTWDSSAGFSDVPDGKPKDPIGALKALVDRSRFQNSDYLFVFKDFHPYLKEPQIQRTFRNLREPNMLNTSDYRRPVLFLGPNDSMPSEIRRSIVDIDFALPGDDDLEKVFEYVKTCVGAKAGKIDAALKRRIIYSMKGMTEAEAEEALFCAVYLNKGFVSACADIVEDEKAKVLKSSGVLTYIPRSQIVQEDEVGGYEEFKRFIRMRAKAYSDKAKELGLSLPKGVALLGPPGTGKTTIGKVAARLLGLPLVMMDFGSVFNSLVGESEARMKATLNQVVSLGGCVLMVDDADKAFRNATSSAGDSGTTQRVFQQFLVWRSEYKGPVFVILTMNTIEGIPPELLRPGRFDSVMCALLPNDETRKRILQIHMAKRKIPDTLTTSQWVRLISITDNFAGAELEGALDEATYAAFDARETQIPSFEELESALLRTTPTATRDRAAIKALVEYCESNKLRSVDDIAQANIAVTRGKRAMAI